MHDPLMVKTGGLPIEEAVKRLRESKQIHANWYRTTYPDAAQIGMHPAEHYLKYGADLGRDPGKGFDTRRYLVAYPEVAETGINPLLHYVLRGAAAGYKRMARDAATPKRIRRRITVVRSKLMALGFTEQPLADFERILEGDPEPLARALAAQELALWWMRERTPEGYRRALDFAARGRAVAELPLRAKFRVAELLSHFHLGDRAAGQALFEAAALAGEMTADLMLGWVNYHDDPAGRIPWINRALAQYGISPVRLDDGPGPSPYDRLGPAGPVEKVEGGPKVSVLLAAYDAAEMLPTALRSLQEQSYQNLEILVLDDCSPDEGATVAVARAFAAHDPRIRVVPMEQNGGAYVARNHGLDLATGDFVTIHDADDWSHPLKIETQVRHLVETPETMGCTSQQARATPELSFTRFPHNCDIIRVNVSSFMFRREIMEKLGYWATTRFGADSELIYRIKHVYGAEAVQNLRTGPLSFQRESESSIVKNDAFGIDGFYYGVRHEFFSAYAHHLRSGGELRYDKDPAAARFRFPMPMRPDRIPPSRQRRYDVIVASDYRIPGGSVLSCLEELAAMKRAGLRCAVFCMYRYDLDYGDIRRMTPEVRAFLNAEGIDVLNFGESVACDVLILRYPPILQHRQRYLPEVEAGDIRVIVNQPPRSDYAEDGVLRYELGRAAENLRAQFGRDAVWHPIGPLVRDTLHARHADELHHVELSEADWSNIIDVADWAPETPRAPRRPGPLRIGRHSRDNPLKWPRDREVLAAAYPVDDPEVEVHVLGGADAAFRRIGHAPATWTVHDFGAMHPREFLSDLDAFLYYTHPDWVESFGRAIIEAMAAGVPVILPEIYAPLFGPAALYAPPSEAVARARALLDDPEARDAQVARALRIVRERFSHDTHLRRVAEIRTAVGEAA